MKAEAHGILHIWTTRPTAVTSVSRHSETTRHWGGDPFQTLAFLHAILSPGPLGSHCHLLTDIFYVPSFLRNAGKPAFRDC